jgi:single-stranded DNA-binding protein
VGKIKTRSYVDKDGNNKYITEILADAMIVLEKKQGQGSYSGQSEQPKQDLQDKSNPVNEINEPGTAYNKPSGNMSNSSQEKDIHDNNDPGPGGTFNNGSGEDDLPF